MDRSIGEIISSMKSLRQSLREIPPAEAPEGIEYTDLKKADSSLKDSIDALNLAMDEKRVGKNQSEDSEMKSND
jgi:hypothetical protein